jgi:hypothetical protein
MEGKTFKTTMSNHIFLVLTTVRIFWGYIFITIFQGAVRADRRDILPGQEVRAQHLQQETEQLSRQEYLLSLVSFSSSCLDNS